MGESENITISSGDAIILFTDGIIESRNQEMEHFGIERLKEHVWKHRKDPGKKMAESLLENVKVFTGGNIQDDYTILVIRIL
jgi:serine phosphatase RsbU (regulator of sigma subunit)